MPKKKRRLSQPRKEFKNDEELLEVFKKVEVNLPLLMTIKSIPRYAKFLKELCTHKRRSRSQEKVMVSKNVSSLIKKNLLEKCVNPGNNFASSNEHDLGKDIKDDDEQILKSIGIDNDHDKSTHIENFEKENDLENDSCEVYLHKECENSNSNRLTLPLQKIEIELKELIEEEEARLLETLKRHRQAIGWRLEDLKGIDPCICTHRIHLKEEAKNNIQPQRCFNPTLKEVFKKEVLKLKDVGIIYLVLHSTWVSPIHVVPKKTDMTIMENSQGEFVPTHVSNSWCMCIDYRKLNEVTFKDHFPLPFLDQMV
ncbi:Transposon Ty3-I Gag-Pol polyprotein [Cucumis melo var. makuwa]|uniref:Transposon Ty3-I Gag-Pol polyprotein n=1 Tax=Cucumis melo var. makuwa TaxID=1194695 RepID=A0A5A7UI66_CUCMM|nr:Transposon Ty3-I Gag-Pol polyprotein [Cucumis melo var. makuwa]